MQINLFNLERERKLKKFIFYLALFECLCVYSFFAFILRVIFFFGIFLSRGVFFRT